MRSLEKTKPLGTDSSWTEEMAWAAGIIDGEGCIVISKTLNKRAINPSYWLSMRVIMTHKPTILKLKSLFEVGRLYHREGKGNWRETWYWQITGLEAACVLSNVRPYLVTKRAEADLAMLFMDLPKKIGNKQVPSWLLEEREKIRISMQKEKRKEF